MAPLAPPAAATTFILLFWSVRKLRSHADAVRAELIRLFGDGTDFELELEVEAAASDQVVVVVLGVLLGLSLLGLLVTAGLFCW